MKIAYFRLKTGTSFKKTDGHAYFDSLQFHQVARPPLAPLLLSKEFLHHINPL